MEYKDYYRILGVDRSASSDEIKRAYRRLARKYHPDVSKEPDAETRFKEVSEAYEALSDPEKRAAYDQLGANWKQGQDFRPPPGWEFHTSQRGFDGGEGSFSDFFEAIFGSGSPFGDMGGFRADARHGPGPGRRRSTRRQRGRNREAEITISLADAYHGATRQLSLDDGRGDRRTLRVRIPAGVTDGQQIRLGGQGEPGAGGAGDLLLKVNIAPHPQYRLEGRDVYLELPVAPWEAALGAQLKVPTPGGWIDMKIPAGSQAGQRFRLRGRGLPGKTPGDQYVTLKVVTPRADTEKAKELYRRMQREMPMNPREKLAV